VHLEQRSVRVHLIIQHFLDTDGPITNLRGDIS
jgi:hypothetical protein